MASSFEWALGSGSVIVLGWNSKSSDFNMYNNDRHSKWQINLEWVKKIYMSKMTIFTA